LQEMSDNSMRQNFVVYLLYFILNLAANAAQQHE